MLEPQAIGELVNAALPLRRRSAIASRSSASSSLGLNVHGAPDKPGFAPRHDRKWPTTWKVK